jgi:ATP-dependent DNA helicase RecQ
MIQFATTHRCRRQMILDYFGDDAEVSDCGCDVCRKGGNVPLTLQWARFTSPMRWSYLVRQILSGIARCRGKFGVGVVAEVLGGSTTERTQKWGLNELSTFGLLKPYPIKRIVAMLHRVLETGLARQRDPDGVKFRPVVDLTASGVSVMRGQQPPPADLADLVPAESSGWSKPAARKVQPTDDQPMTPEVEVRFEALRQLRTQIARERGMPPYIICHDSTLKQLALQAPANETALACVKGLGPYKIRMYGQAFLDVLRRG